MLEVPQVIIAIVVLLLVAVTGLAVVPLRGRLWGSRAAARRAVGPQVVAPKPDLGQFTILQWNGRPPPAGPSPGPPSGPPSEVFRRATVQTNPAALCLMTGLTAGECGCPTHRRVR
jgi:hypothetical protein